MLSIVFKFSRQFAVFHDYFSRNVGKYVQKKFYYKTNFFKTEEEYDENDSRMCRWYTWTTEYFWGRWKTWPQ
jgi:hypothetical protein